MKKWLKTIPTQRIIEIAHDLGFTKQDVNEAILFIVAAAEAYRVRIEDLQARYPDLQKYPKV